MEEKASVVGCKEKEKEKEKEKDGGGKQEEEGEGAISTSAKYKYCVTGATGYIGSWLVNSLLLRGFIVHATVRHLAAEKSLYLLQKWEGARDRLKLFEADLQEEGSFDEAMRGCHGLFHVAASMELQVSVEDNVDSYVQTKVIKPAIEGTLNVMRCWLRSGSIKRVVFTSSISTLTARDGLLGIWKSFVDETSYVSVGQVWKNKSTGWVYVLSKLLTEQAAFEFCKENEMDMVSVVTTTVGGPFLTSTVPASIRLLLSPLTGDPLLSSILASVNSRMGSIAMVHIEDICNAHVFLMEHPAANGRYICSAKSCGMSQLVSCLLEHYPYTTSTLQRIVGEEHESVPPVEISSKRLKDLGFKYIYGVQDIIGDSVVKCIECGFLHQNFTIKS